MADRRGFSWGAAAIGALAMLALLVLAALVVIFGGLYPVTASSGYPPAVRWALEKAMHEGVTSGADSLQPPRLTQAQVLEGGSHFKAMCQRCHGGPGAKPEQFATAMDPDPPELAHAAKEWSRSEIFWIAKHGVKMTGMPAFGAYEGDRELWKIAAFVKQLPQISASDYAAIPAASGHGHGGSGPKEGHSPEAQGH